jgi:hypothetical protein
VGNPIYRRGLSSPDAEGRYGFDSRVDELSSTPYLMHDYLLQSRIALRIELVDSALFAKKVAGRAHHVVVQ